MATNYEKLYKAVKDQTGADDDQEFREILEDVSRSSYGASAGFSGFIYYSETLEFYARNRKLILEIINDECQDLGFKNAMESVRAFNCISDLTTDEEIAKTLYCDKRAHDQQVANALAWFALEHVAFHMSCCQ